MRVIRFLVAIVCLALGAVLGALNRQAVSIDVGFGYVASNLGIVMLGCLLIGVIVGGMAISASVVWPLRRRLANAQRQTPADPSAAKEVP